MDDTVTWRSFPKIICYYPKVMRTSIHSSDYCPCISDIRTRLFDSASSKHTSACTRYYGCSCSNAIPLDSKHNTLYHMMAFTNAVLSPAFFKQKVIEYEEVPISG